MGVTALAGGALLAPAAMAGTSNEIYERITRDLADNGQLDGAYTAEEIAAVMKDATVQGYGNTIVVLLPPETAVEVQPAAATAVTPPTALTSLPSGALTPPVPVISPAVEQANPPAAGEVAGQEKTVTAKPQAQAKPTGVAGQQSPLRTTRTTGTLPFTGAELLLFAIVGGALLLSGMLLRTTARQKARS